MSVFLLLMFSCVTFFAIPIANGATVDWYDSCEDVNVWSFYNGATGFIDTAIQQEGFGCLEINVQDGSTGKRAILDREIDSDEQYFGFWVRRGSNMNCQLIIYDSTVSYYINIFKGGGDTFQWSILDDGGFYGYTSTRPWNANTWYWVEVRHSGGAYYFSVNGVSAGSYLGGGTWWSYDEFRFCTGLAIGAHGKLYLDYLRVANDYEFPPLPVVPSNVIPEIPFGTIGVAATMIIALGVFAIKKKKRKIDPNSAFNISH